MSETLKALQEMQAQLDWLQGRIPGVVIAARHQGHTWAEIGKALGISPQGAQKRFSPIALPLDIEAGTAGTE